MSLSHFEVRSAYALQMARMGPRSCLRYVLLDICASLSEQTLAHTMLALHDSKELIQCLGKSRPTFAACACAPRCVTGTLQTSTSTFQRLLWLMAAGQQAETAPPPLASLANLSPRVVSAGGGEAPQVKICAPVGCRVLDSKITQLTLSELGC